MFVGRKLWVVKIATEKKRPDLKPMVKYLANMHGNEAVGKELMIGLVEYLAETYKNGSNPEITQLVSTMDIHLMPSMNPDGFENSSIGFCSHSPTGRHNMNDVDLNRNFPTWDDQNFTDVNQLYNNRHSDLFLNICLENEKSEKIETIFRNCTWSNKEFRIIFEL